jgi:hypothetical protein
VAVGFLLGVLHHQQLDYFGEQMRVQLADAGEPIEFAQDFLDGTLHAVIRVLLAQGWLTADADWRQGIIAFTALALRRPTLLHAVENHR